MIELGISALVTLCCVPGLMLRYVPFQNIANGKQKRTLFSAYTVACILNVLVMYLVFSGVRWSSSLLKIDMYVFGFAMTLINILILRGKTREHLFVYGIIATCNYLVVSLPTMFTSFLVGLDGVQSYVVGVLSHGAVLALCYLPTRMLLRNTVEPFLTLEGNGRDYWGMIWFIPMAMRLTMAFAFPTEVHEETANYLFSRAMIGIAMILLCYSVAKDYKRMEERQLLAEQLTEQKLHYAQLQQQVEAARKSRHDFKHHLAAVQRYIDTDDKEGLQDYCYELSAESAADTQIPYTGNPAADGVLYRYMRLSKENDVRFSFSGRIKSDGIANMDLCVLLGNALDNALEGCLTASGPRELTVIAQTEAQMLSVLVRNSFDGTVKTENGKLLSRKRKNAPGVGMRSMQSVCDRYGGTLSTQWDEDTFTTLFVLPIRNDS